MIGERDRVAKRLAELRAPDEEGAEERSWPLVREAYAERTPVRPTRRNRQLALAAVGGLAVLAIGLSPAGAKVGDLVSDVVGISGEDARPELGTLPAAGEVLVETDVGTWIVGDDGSRTLLGEYEDAVWSPHGRYVAAASGSALVALDPGGEVQWTVPTSVPPSEIAWEGTEFDTRIAYRVGDELHVVAGDGTGARRVARDVEDRVPVWLERSGDTKVDPRPGDVFPYELVLRDRSRALPSPVGEASAVVERSSGRSTVAVRENGKRRVVFAGPGRITDPVWSPDGRWLLFGWREADQWVFVQPERPREVIAVDAIAEKFDAASDSFPRARAWVLPSR